MTDYQFALLMGFGVKALTMLSGVVAIALGYKLFTRGIYKGGAGIKVEGWKAAVAMDRGGPGLLFALFGAIVLVVGILRPVTASHERTAFEPDERVTDRSVMAPVSPVAVGPAAVALTVREQASLAPPPEPPPHVVREQAALASGEKRKAAPLR